MKSEEAVTLVWSPHEAVIKGILDEQPQADLRQWCSYEEESCVICKWVSSTSIITSATVMRFIAPHFFLQKLFDCGNKIW